MKLITGNLLDIRSGVILHQVNCRGVVGGLAAVLASKWPAAFAPYYQSCRRDGHFALGHFVLGEAESGLRIGHVFGQLNPGPTTDMDAVNHALFEGSMLEFAGPVYAPFKMGCGIGGGDWEEYAEELEQFFPEIMIVQREEDAR